MHSSVFSSSTKRTVLLLGLLGLCLQSAYAHTYLSSVVLNDGTPLAEGDCVRPHPATAYDSPIPLVTQADMTCGFLPAAAQPANRRCPIAAGQKIGLQWHHQSAAPGDDIVDPSHVGPIIVYLAKSDTGAGNVWFKIYEDGYTNGVWAVTKLIANGGRVDITLPSDIAPGNYLLRGELIALHGSYALNGVQPYVGCVELTISGSGSANPSGVALPGYYTNTDPGMLFNIYQTFTTYPIPGPPLYKSGSSSSSSSSSSSGSASGSNTAAPTSSPGTSAPTTKPTGSPATSAPTSPPSAANIRVGLNSGSSAWWVGVIVSGGGETTVRVELTDSGSVTNWVSLVDESYAYTYSASVQLKAPLSLRLTSSTGKQVTLPNVFSSFATPALIDTGKAYSTSATTAPTSKPTAAPTSKPTSKPPTAPTTRPTSAPTTKPPTNPPSSGSAKVTVGAGSNNWWLSLTVSGNTESISKVELKDAGSVSSYTALANEGWAYTFGTQGTPLVAPATIRVTTASGKTATATVSNFTPGTSASLSSAL